MTGSHSIEIEFEFCGMEEGAGILSDRLTCPPGSRSPRPTYSPTATESDCFAASQAIGNSVTIPDSVALDSSSTLRDSSGFSHSSTVGDSSGFDDSVKLQDSFVIDYSAKIVDSVAFDSSSTLRDSSGFSHSSTVRDSMGLENTVRIPDSFVLDYSVKIVDSFVVDSSSTLRDSSGFSYSSTVRDSFGFDHSAVLLSGPLPGSRLFLLSGDFDGSLPFSKTPIFSFSQPAAVSGGFPETHSFTPAAPRTTLAETDPFTGSLRFVGGDQGNRPDSEPSYLWIGIGAGLGFLVLVAIAVGLFLFVRNRNRSEGGSENSTVAPPVEASSWEVSVLPVEEYVESFNPVASSGEGSGDEFAVVSDEAEPV
jgi:hypothetical protein